ncbi:DMT family transporter [Celerinatantimonas sp. YJH-8]|uniref:DMT family transporter n=1 Tax=Celerinatantimonas sp. YJH-8 TaxID=3228714 RepID=UPI0038C5F59C
MHHFVNRRSGLPHPYFMLLMAPVIWSSSNVIGKLSVGLLSSYQLTFYRWLVATVVLGLMFWRRIRADGSQLLAHKWWFLIWGGSAFCVFNLLLYSAFAYGARAVNVAIIHSLIPVMTLVLSVLLMRQRVHYLQGVGIGCSLFGVLWLLTDGALGALLSWRPTPADSLILISAVIYAAYSLALRRAPSSVHWSSQMWAMCLAALLVATPFWLFDSLRGSQWHWLEPEHPSSLQITRALAIIVYVGIFIAIISKLFYMEGVIALGGNRAALVMNLLPLFSTAMALAVFADERAGFSSVYWVALGCVSLGIVLSEFGARRRARLCERVMAE